MNDRLNNIVAAVVPGESEVVGRVMDASDPAQVGRTIRGPSAYRLFLVNEGELDIASVDLYAGGFASEDDGVVELERVSCQFGEIRARSARLLETLDPGQLDFVLWYELKLTFADALQLRAKFDIAKSYALRASNRRFFAALNDHAFAFALSPDDRSAA